MIIVSSYCIAVAMCIITMICWGSWANTQKLVGKKKWPFQLFYWDYVIGLFALSLILAFTMGSIGHQGRRDRPPRIRWVVTAAGTGVGRLAEQCCPGC